MRITLSNNYTSGLLDIRLFIFFIYLNGDLSSGIYYLELRNSSGSRLAGEKLIIE